MSHSSGSDSSDSLERPTALAKDFQRNTSRSWCVAAVAVVCFAAGVTLSMHLEPGIRVESGILAGDTPTLKFLPRGPGPHPLALLAHGVTASKETLFRLGEALAAAGFLSFAVDLPGHGESRRRFAPLECASTLEHLTQALGRVDVFVGHSMGAYAGAQAVRQGGLSPRLFVAIGAIPNLSTDGPPLLLLAGRFEEFFSPARLELQTGARLVVSPWSDHALEPYDPLLVNACVAASCAALGKPPPAAPTCWLWRLAGLVLSGCGALGLGLSLPALFPSLVRVQGPVLSLLLIAAFVLAGNSWAETALHWRRADLLLGALAATMLMLAGAGRLHIPRWGFLALAVLLAIGCMLASTLTHSASASGRAHPFQLYALLASLGALILGAGTVLGWLGARGGSRLKGDVAMALFVGYALGQWMPRFIL